MCGVVASVDGGRLIHGRLITTEKIMKPHLAPRGLAIRGAALFTSVAVTTRVFGSQLGLAERCASKPDAAFEVVCTAPTSQKAASAGQLAYGP